MVVFGMSIIVEIQNPKKIKIIGKQKLSGINKEIQPFPKL